jgi:DegV family protein with EDD domain
VDHPGVDLVEFPYIAGGIEHVDDFYRSVTPHEFFQTMRDKKNEAPTTSQIPTRTLYETFKRAFESGVPTVYLCFTSGLSGSYDAAVLLRDQMVQEYPGGKLLIVDTKLASIAEGLLVLEAINQRDKGLTADEMVAWVEEARYYVNAQFMVDDLDSLRRGGRIPASVAMAGAKLDVKPLLGFDLEGKLSLVGVARGRKKGIRQLTEFYKKRVDDTEINPRIVLGGSDCPRDIARLRDELTKVADNALFLETSIGPVIGSHVGPDMIAIVFWGPDCRKDISVADRIARHVKDKE